MVQELGDPKVQAVAGRIILGNRESQSVDPRPFEVPLSEQAEGIRRVAVTLCGIQSSKAIDYTLPYRCGSDSLRWVSRNRGATCETSVQVPEAC